MTTTRHHLNDQIMVKLSLAGVREARRLLADLDTEQLAAIDTEYARRAGLVGQSGVVSRIHAVVKNELWSAMKEDAR
jgi:glutaminase